MKAQIRTKNFSARPLRHTINSPIRTIVRLGSLTPTSKAFPKSFGKKKILEINTVSSIENSRSKLLMKDCFKQANVNQSEWFILECSSSNKSLIDVIKQKPIPYTNLPYPLIAKRIYGFKGHGMVKIDTVDQLDEFIKKTPSLGSYYFEKFYNYAREYRLHITKEGCFMCWRKLRRLDSENRWFFNSSNCNWVNENHKLFDKPHNWKTIEKQCIKALEAVSLDIGACDVRVQSSSNSKSTSPKFIIIEINSAPSLGSYGIEMYTKKIKELINNKYENQNT